MTGCFIVQGLVNERIAKIESNVMDISEKIGILILQMQNGEEMGIPASRNSSVISAGAMDGYRGTTASECKFLENVDHTH